MTERIRACLHLDVAVTPRAPGLYVVFDGRPDVGPATFLSVEDEEGSAVLDGEFAWREEATGIWSLGPLVDRGQPRRVPYDQDHHANREGSRVEDLGGSEASS